MKEVPEIHETPEKHITEAKEKRIETFDDLKTSDKSRQIETFDDIGKQTGSARPIETFDDIAKSKEGTILQEISGNSEKGTFDKDTPEAIEHERLGQAAEDMKKLDWMKPEKWETLGNDEKRIALEHSGRVLGEVYHTPDPPLFTEKAPPDELGKYGDGYSFDRTEPSNPEKYTGFDYRIKMNEEGVKEIDKRLFGDDPKIALETYAHEFRHSYQTEQAHAFDKGFETDNPENAKEWSENLKDYRNPPIPELAKSNPDRYFEMYEVYRNQPVEEDAREFAENLSSRIYEDNRP